MHAHLYRNDLKHLSEVGEDLEVFLTQVLIKLFKIC